MDLYCIKTHSQGVVKEGNVYPKLGEFENPCCGLIAFNVGIHLSKHFVGNKYTCSLCGGSFIDKSGIHWVSSRLFSFIDDISIKEAIEALETRELEEV